MPGRCVSWKRSDAAFMAASSNGSDSPLIFALNQPFLLVFEAYIAGGRTVAIGGSECRMPKKHILNSMLAEY